MMFEKVTRLWTWGKLNYENLSRIYSNYSLSKNSTMSLPLSLSKCIAKKVLLTPNEIIDIFASSVQSTSFMINLLISSIDSLHLPFATRCLWTLKWIVVLEIDGSLCTT
jgi:hypothetical protein